MYNFADLKLVDQIDTISNPKGLCALSPSGTNNVVACPGRQHGHVHLELYDTKKTTLVKAHEVRAAPASRIATCWPVLTPSSPPC